MHRAFEQRVAGRDRPQLRNAVEAGFTMIEMITVIAITGIIAGAVAVFLRVPLQSYQDAQRRASISDAADTAFVVLKRELQSALPNSVRVTNAGAVFHLEFLQTRTAGRYRSDASSAVVPAGANTCPDTDADGFAAAENVLQFGVADTCFTTLGPLADLNAIVANADFIAVYNLGPGFTGADAYASGNATGGNKSVITSAAAGGGGENVIRFQSNAFDLESPGRRVHVISGAVSYVCDPAAGTLRRFAGYAISPAQTPPAGASVLLARGITACTMTYDQNAINQRTGVVAIWLIFGDPNATTVNLFQQVQVSNVP